METRGSMRGEQFVTAYWDVDCWYWSDDEFYGHYLLEKVRLFHARFALFLLGWD